MARIELSSELRAIEALIDGGKWEPAAAGINAAQSTYGRRPEYRYLLYLFDTVFHRRPDREVLRDVMDLVGEQPDLVEATALLATLYFRQGDRARAELFASVAARADVASARARGERVLGQLDGKVEAASRPAYGIENLKQFPSSPEPRERPSNPAAREQPSSPTAREQPPSVAGREFPSSPAVREMPSSPAACDQPSSPAAASVAAPAPERVEPPNTWEARMSGARAPTPPPAPPAEEVRAMIGREPVAVPRRIPVAPPPAPTPAPPPPASLRLPGQRPVIEERRAATGWFLAEGDAPPSSENGALIPSAEAVWSHPPPGGFVPSMRSAGHASSAAAPRDLVPDTPAQPAVRPASSYSSQWFDLVRRDRVQRAPGRATSSTVDALLDIGRAVHEGRMPLVPERVPLDRSGLQRVDAALLAWRTAGRPSERGETMAAAGFFLAVVLHELDATASETAADDGGCKVVIPSGAGARPVLVAARYAKALGPSLVESFDRLAKSRAEDGAPPSGRLVPPPASSEARMTPPPLRFETAETVRANVPSPHDPRRPR